MPTLKQPTDAQWFDRLRSIGAEPQAFEITRHGATEAPFSGKYLAQWADGSYHCIICDSKLFDASAKFDAHCGWPSFDLAVPAAITQRIDQSHAMSRVEVLCCHCGAHLGHMFTDGPSATGLRYCINSASLKFAPA